MKTKIKSNQTVLFIGDSITDCGRRGAEKPLGIGYVKLFSDLMTTREPEKHFSIINKGIGGDRVTGLHARWSDDVIVHKPDWLSVKIGINDLHSALFANDINSVTPEVFEKNYDEILARTKKELPRCQILLIDPFYISRERNPNTRRSQILKTLPKYIAVVHKMSRKYGTRLIKTHEIYQSLLRHHDADTFCPEPVHPNMTGHLVIAEAVYNALCR